MSAQSTVVIQTVARTEELAGARALAAARRSGIARPRVVAAACRGTDGPVQRWALLVAER
jgi:hypothetical protein